MDASVNRIPSSKDERALVFGIRLRGGDSAAMTNSLEELELLVKTAGAIVVGKRVVNRDRIDPSFIVGKGYLSQVEELIRDQNIRLIVFDLNAIRPAQIRTLEDRLKCRVVGRTEIIMDIFARRALSAESKIQVELAQLKYILPRLKGLGGVLSRLGGGIGTRGPGEKMLETDRRHVLRRIESLKRKLDRIQKHRDTARKGRRRSYTGAVVGYTNAGKSTLINALARDDLFVEDRLFATLDSFTRTVHLADGKKCLLTDTVGFIRNLPSNLIESFRSTLEEIQNAVFLVHVIDISSHDIQTCIQTVNRELGELGCSDKPTLLFFNKSDLLPDDSVSNSIRNNFPGAVIGSAARKTGIEELKSMIIGMMESWMAGDGRGHQVFPDEDEDTDNKDTFYY